MPLASCIVPLLNPDFVVCLETRSWYGARLALNSRPSYLSLWNSGIIDMPYHNQLPSSFSQPSQVWGRQLKNFAG